MFRYYNKSSYSRFESLVRAGEAVEKERVSALNEFRFEPFKVGVPKRFKTTKEKEPGPNFSIGFPVIPLLSAVTRGFALATTDLVSEKQRTSSKDVLKPFEERERRGFRMPVNSPFAPILSLGAVAGDLGRDAVAQGTRKAIQLAIVVDRASERLETFHEEMKKDMVVPSKAAVAVKIERIRSGLPYATEIGEMAKSSMQLAFEQMRRINMLAAMQTIPRTLYSAAKSAAGVLLEVSKKAIQTGISVVGTLAAAGYKAAEKTLGVLKDLAPSDTAVAEVFEEAIEPPEDSAVVNTAETQLLQQQIEESIQNVDDDSTSLTRLFAQGLVMLGEGTIASANVLFGAVQMGGRVVLPILRTAVQLGMLLGQAAKGALNFGVNAASLLVPGAALPIAAGRLIVNMSQKVTTVLSGIFSNVIDRLGSVFRPVDVPQDLSLELKTLLKPEVTREIYGLNNLLKVSQLSLDDESYAMFPTLELPAPGDDLQPVVLPEDVQESVNTFMLAYRDFKQRHPDVILNITRDGVLAARNKFEEQGFYSLRNTTDDLCVLPPQEAQPDNQPSNWSNTFASFGQFVRKTASFFGRVNRGEYQLLKANDATYHAVTQTGDFDTANVAPSIPQAGPEVVPATTSPSYVYNTLSE